MSNVVTGTEAGFSGDDQIKIVLKYIYNKNGVAQTKELYSALESKLNGKKLSEQGKASLRFFINKVAVQAGFINPYDADNPGWRITKEGIDYIQNADISEVTINTETNEEETSLSNSARGLSFEKYILEWLKFLSGCFARRVDDAVFITTGRLKTEQYREAREGKVLVIQGKEEITRIAKQNNFKKFDLFEDDEAVDFSFDH